MINIKNCGILLRGYAKDEKEIANVAERIQLSAKKAWETGFGTIIILIPGDKDCGKTKPAITDKLFDFGPRDVLVHQVPGNENTDVLNFGLKLLSRINVTNHAFIVSNKAVGYLNTANVNKMLTSFAEGARVSGLAVRDLAVSEDKDEIFHGVLEGRLSNIFCAWDIDALDYVQGFDSAIGVEEMAPIVHLIRNYGRCIAPVLPVGEESLNISPLRAEHWAKISSTKTGRQLLEVKRACGDFDKIKKGILSGYPK